MRRTLLARPDRCDKCRMRLTPACPRSPLLLSRHGIRCIRHCWRHAGWLSIGHTPPYGKWHRYLRLESADGAQRWLYPAEQWQVGRQQPKREKGAGRSRTDTRGNDSRNILLSGTSRVSNRTRLPISDTDHVSPATGGEQNEGSHDDSPQTGGCGPFLVVAAGSLLGNNSPQQSEKQPRSCLSFRDTQRA